MSDKGDPAYWQYRQWLTSRDIPENVIERATVLEEREKALFDCIPADSLNEAIICALTDSLEASYAIENENLDLEALKSFVTERIGKNAPLPGNSERYSGKEDRAAAAALTVLSDRPLSHATIIDAHRILEDAASVGYREHGEYVVNGSGMIVYRAPEAEHVRSQMNKFLDWWENERPLMPTPVGSAIAHYIVVCIHPFADGNGRLARIIAEKTLISSEEKVLRPYSVSSAILKRRLDYYRALGSKNPLDFVNYILRIHEQALESAFGEARRLQFLKYFFERDEFTESEKRIIEKMSLDIGSRWRADDYFGVEVSSTVWNSLQLRGVITDAGSLNIHYRPRGSTDITEAQTGSSEDAHQIDCAACKRAP